MTAKDAMRIRNDSMAEDEVFDFKELHKCIDEALEKQIPMKPKEYEDKFYACKCGNILLMKWKKYPAELMPKSEGLPYCLNCGQTLDWGEKKNN